MPTTSLADSTSYIVNTFEHVGGEWGEQVPLQCGSAWGPIPEKAVQGVWDLFPVQLLTDKQTRLKTLPSPLHLRTVIR